MDAAQTQLMPPALTSLLVFTYNFTFFCFSLSLKAEYVFLFSSVCQKHEASRRPDRCLFKNTQIFCVCVKDKTLCWTFMFLPRDGAAL